MQPFWQWSVILFPFDFVSQIRGLNAAPPPPQYYGTRLGIVDYIKVSLPTSCARPLSHIEICVLIGQAALLLWL